MQMAIEYEANRQVDVIEEGGSIDQETRLFDIKNQTRSMRSKKMLMIIDIFLTQIYHL